MIKKVILPLLIVFSFENALAKMGKPTGEMDAILKTLDSKKGKPIETLSAQEARKQPTPADAVKTLMKNKKIEDQALVTVQDIKVEGAQGQIPARVYIPAGANKPMPVVVYFHGGGWVLADYETYDATPRSLADKTKAIFISVEYRKAPEYKFPAAHEDAYATYQWVLKNAQTFDGDPKRVAVAGESAGGNLSIGRIRAIIP